MTNSEQLALSLPKDNSAVEDEEDKAVGQDADVDVVTTLKV